MRIKEDYSMRGRRRRRKFFMSLVKIIFIMMKHKIKTEKFSFIFLLHFFGGISHFWSGNFFSTSIMRINIEWVRVIDS